MTKDEAPLDVLASVLGQGRNSRLYKSLVYDNQIAQQVNAFSNTRELAGTFQITAVPRRGVSIDSLEASINRVVADMLSTPPATSDLTRAYNASEARLIYSLQSVGGFGGKSDQLNEYAIFTGNPGYFENDLARYRAVTPADVERVAKTYLTNDKLVFTVTPVAGQAPSRRADAASAQAGDSAQGREIGSLSNLNASLPAGGPDPKFTLPTIQRRKLSNGLDVLIVEHHELPVVTMNLVVKGGTSAEPAGHAGLAAVTASLLNEGTESKSALQLSDALSSIGAALNSSADWDASRLSLTTLTRQLEPALGIFADVLMHPAFNDADIRRIRAQRLQQLAGNRDNANAIASQVYASLLYGPDHPYGHPQNGTEASLSGFTADDFRTFHSTYYRPNNSTLIVVGDVKPDAIVAQLEKAFTGWTAATVPQVAVDAKPVARDHTTIYLVDRPGAAQSVIDIGTVGVSRTAPDYFPRLVLNQMLGGSFVSRVNLNLREAKGYTYGARTSFDYRRGAGPFTASAGVQTAVTKESVYEFLKELRGIRGDIPVTQAELDRQSSR
jgi:zinc protease